MPARVAALLLPACAHAPAATAAPLGAVTGNLAAAAAIAAAAAAADRAAAAAGGGDDIDAPPAELPRSPPPSPARASLDGFNCGGACGGER